MEELRFDFMATVADIDTKNVVDVINTADNLLKAGDHEAAIEYYCAWLNKHTDESMGYVVAFNVGVMLKDVGRDDDAEVYYKEAIKRNQKCLHARFSLAMLLNGKGQPLEAIEQLKDAVLVCKEDGLKGDVLYIQSLNAVGKLLESNYCYSDALDYITRSLVIDGSQKAISKIRNDLLSKLMDASSCSGSKYHKDCKITNINEGSGKRYFADIIIPTHGRPHLLQRAVRSIRRQNFNDFYRLIIVSDEISSGTLSAIKPQLLPQDVYIQHGTALGGPAESRNIGLKYVDSEYVLFLDDDDSYADNFLRQLFNKLSVVSGNVFAVDFDFLYEHRGDDYADVYNSVRLFETMSGVEWSNLYVRNFLPNNAVVYRSSALHGKYFDGSIGYEDWDFLLSVLIDNPITYLPMRGPLVHKMDYGLSDTRGAKTRNGVVDTFVEIYKRWKPESDYVSNKRVELLSGVGVDYFSIISA